MEHLGVERLVEGPATERIFVERLVEAPGAEPTFVERLAGAARRIEATSGYAHLTPAVELLELSAALAALPAARATLAQRALAPLGAVLDEIVPRLSGDAPPDPSSHRALQIVERRVRCTLGYLEEVHESPSGVEGDAEAYLLPIYRQVDLRELFRILVEPAAQVARRRGVDLKADVPAEAVPSGLDPIKISFVVLNLVFNACKYTPRGGTIECALRGSGDSGGVVIEVRDSGPGVPSANVGHLFRRWRQTDPPRSVVLHEASVQGLGLHLGASRDYVELHGGTLVLHPEQRGCSFRARLPHVAPPGIVYAHPSPHLFTELAKLAAGVAARAEEELEREAALSGSVEGRSSRPTVLIVESTPALQRRIASCLEPDYATVSASSGVEGLRAAFAARPDLIIADLHLPERDGEAMLQQVRASPDLAHTMVLVVTAGHEADAADLLDRGAHDLLRKPFATRELRARVRNLLRHKTTRDILNRSLGRRESDLVRLVGEVSRQQVQLEAAVTECRAAREQAESSSRIKSNFLRIMAHELKTPMAAMRLQLELLDRVIERDDTAEGPHYAVAGLRRSGARLLALVDTVLEWSRVQDGRRHLRPERIELRALLEEIIEQVRPQAELRAAELVLTSDLAPALVSDRKLLGVVLSNLLLHVVQETRQRSIPVGIEHGGSDLLVVVVRDGRPELSDTAMTALFSPFAADLDGAAGAGSGLGLYVVRDLARALGGEVDLASHSAAGNTYRLTLPHGLAAM